MNEHARLVRCFGEVFPQLSEKEIVKASKASVGSWDSVATVTLVALVEEEFGIRVGSQEIEEVTSFDLILDHIRNHKNDH